MGADETMSLEGLEAPGSIGVDANGIPHIRAANERDLFFLQGFNAARDRLFQIDLWRKRGLGLLAADFGPGYLEQDRAARLFLYRGDMAAEFAAYSTDAHAIASAFAAGVNAFIDQVDRGAAPLPFEFGVLGTRPARWAAEDVVRVRTHSLTRNALSEVLRCLVLREADHRADAIRRHLNPPIVPGDTGVDPASVPLAALDLFKLAGANVTFTKERLAARLEDAAKWRGVTDLNEVILDAAWSGSNNWAIHGSLSETGAPLLASDPHRLHGMPSLRTLVHLTCPTLDLIGAGEPSSPGVAIGFNGVLAWALTIFYIDQEDMVVCETHPDDPTFYRFGAGYERMRTIEERVAVKGHPDQVLRLHFTRHGPVVHVDRAAGRAYAVRSVWFEPGTAPYLRTLSLMRATDIASFRTGVEGWGTPSVNFVCATKTGDIAWTPAGMNPIRPGFDGLLPVPGDGRCEWDGFRDPAAMPMTLNPAEGFVFSANQMNLPADWDHGAHPIGHEWVDPARATRIEEVLRAARPHGVAQSRALQTDVVSIPARRLCRLLGAIQAPGADAARALLGDWDHALAADSGPAALFEVWWTRHLRKGLYAAIVPPAVHRFLPPGDVEGVLEALEAPDDRFGADPAAARDRLLVDTLAAAFAECAALLGPDPATWAWGRLHHGAFDHPLAALLAPEEAARLAVGPLPKGGSSVTPMHTGYRPSDFRIVMGSTIRIVFDLGDPDRSVAINAPGQSGDPASPHYRDLAARWAAGDYAPLPYSRAAVDAAVRFRLDFRPA